MKVWQRISFCTVIALLAVWPAGSALGASVSGRSSTEIEWFDDAQEDTATPIYQYLRLNVKDLGWKGLSFKGYGRLADDLSDEVDIDSRLYYAYLEKKGVIENLDLKLGRQFISTTAGASIMDGIYLNYKNLGPVNVKFFGGGDVAYYKGYSAEDLIVGTEVSGRFLKTLDLGLSYLQKWDDSQLSHELFGLDADYDYKEMLNAYSEVQYDYLSDSISYFLGGLKYYKNPDWSVRTEYLYSLPVFSSTSIYSVFAVEEYQELMAQLDYKIETGMKAFARYSRELYGEVDDANVFEVGVEKIRTERLSGYLTGVIRDDSDGQDLKGIKARAAYLFNEHIQAGIGVHLDSLERRIDANQDETTSSRIWADVTGYINKKMNVEAKVERVESDLWDDYYRGRIRLNILF